MKKGFYFPHFYDARNDVKIIKLRRVHGLEGYAIYFCLLEMLRAREDFRLPLSSIPEIEYELRVSKEVIFSVIKNFELFEFDENENFYSQKLIENLEPYIKRSEVGRKAVQSRWDKERQVKQLPENCNQSGVVLYERNTDVLPSYYERNTDVIQINKNKINKNKINKSKIKGGEGGENSDEFSQQCYFSHYHLKLSEEQFDRLVAEFGEAETTEILNSIQQYSNSYLKKYSDCYRLARNWLKREKEKKPKFRT